KHWGNISGGTSEEKLAVVRRLNNDLRAGPGDTGKGKGIFRERCATCHQLFGEGTAVGPDLTHANRHDRDYLLLSLVDPSAVIRKEYLMHIVAMHDGRLLSGLLAEQSPQTITLLAAKGERTVVARDNIDQIRESPVSLMPDDLLKDIKPQGLRDLF